MFYQPIFSTEKNKVISAEALIRLNDRVLGYVSPEDLTLPDIMFYKKE